MEISKYNEIKKKCKGYKTYFTFDCENSKSFLIYVKKDIYIYKKEDKENMNDLNFKNQKIYYTDFVSYFQPEKIFIGKSIKLKITISNGNYGKKVDGNTVLLHLNERNYVFIKDNSIEYFNIPKEDIIIKYYSLLLNCNTPLSIAIGKKNIYFLNFIEGYLSKTVFPSFQKEEDLQKIVEEGFQIYPFLFSITTHKSITNNITLEEFRDIQKKELKDIPLKLIKKLANMYHVTLSGTKQEIANSIENLRGVKIGK